MNMLGVPKYTVNTRAWYGRLRGFLFSKGFEMGKFDKTPFLLR
jgi:CRISPR/Cas system-associated protein endoribonuclease Cas2